MREEHYWSRPALRRMTRRAWLSRIGLPGAGLAALAAAGCSSSNNTSTARPTQAAVATSAGTGAATTAAATISGSPAAARAASPAAASAAAGFPVASNRGGTLQRYNTIDFSFDQLSLFSSASTSFVNKVYSGLLTHRPDVDPLKAYSYVVVPDLAMSWETPDKLTYIFKLNTQAQFHPKPPTNGRKVTTDDVIQTYQKFISTPTNSGRTQFAVVDGNPAAIDAQTIQFKTKTPFAPFLSSLIAYRDWLYIYPVELVQDDKLRTSNPVGTGAFMFKQQQSGSFAEFEKHPSYFGKDSAGGQLPYVDGIKYSIIPEPANQLAQFLAGNVDEATVSVDDFKQVQSQVKGVNSIKLPPAANHIVYPQLRNGPFQDLRLRQAVSMAIDRDGILQAMANGEGSWNNICFSAMGKWYVDPRSPDAGPNVQYLKYNPSEAKKLVDAAGFSGQIDYSYPRNGYGDPFVQQVQLIIANLNAVGIKARAVPLDYTTGYIAPGGKGAFYGDFQGLLAGYNPAQPHAYNTFNNLLHTGGVHNSEGLSDASLDKMIDDLAQEFDDAAALAKARAITDWFMQNLPLVPTAGGATYLVSQSKVVNSMVNPAYSDESAKYIWKKSG